MKKFFQEIAVRATAQGYDRVTVEPINTTTTRIRMMQDRGSKNEEHTISRSFDQVGVDALRSFEASGMRAHITDTRVDGYVHSDPFDHLRRPQWLDNHRVVASVATSFGGKK